MPQQYVITVDVDMSESEDPASLSSEIVSAVSTATLAVPGVQHVMVVGVS